MLNQINDPASGYFHCTNRERAIFEAGIKLGTIYHQYVGVPINLSNLTSLENAIKESVMVQPFVVDASVKIDSEVVKKRQGVYKYITLSGDMLAVSVKIRYEDAEVTGFLHYVEKMDYPLMYVGD
ncbi:MAG: dihydroneopterin aldolase family protein [Candidatus Thermoplasmatota archaeon]|nr:dihydroneopterin aldolase family protein [Candidatus Thermoplasmatota archaeon]